MGSSPWSADVFVHYEGWGMENDEWVAKATLTEAPKDIDPSWVGPNGVEDNAKWVAVRELGVGRA
jgi:hypothetical protein